MRIQWAVPYGTRPEPGGGLDAAGFGNHQTSAVDGHAEAAILLCVEAAAHEAGRSCELEVEVLDPSSASFGIVHREEIVVPPDRSPGSDRFRIRLLRLRWPASTPGFYALCLSVPGHTERLTILVRP